MLVRVARRVRLNHGAPPPPARPPSPQPPSARDLREGRVERRFLPAHTRLASAVHRPRRRLSQPHRIASAQRNAARCRACTTVVVLSGCSRGAGKLVLEATSNTTCTPHILSHQDSTTTLNPQELDHKTCRPHAQHTSRLRASRPPPARRRQQPAAAACCAAAQPAEQPA